MESRAVNAWKTVKTKAYLLFNVALDGCFSDHSVVLVLMMISLFLPGHNHLRFFLKSQYPDEVFIFFYTQNRPCNGYAVHDTVITS